MKERNLFGPPDRGGELYLDLLLGCLTRSLFPETEIPGNRAPAIRTRPLNRFLFSALERLLRPLGLTVSAKFQPERREKGLDWPVAAETMIGVARMRNIQDCLTAILTNGVPGDLLETGVWRGGACIWMRAILQAWGAQDRLVWVCDSFEGLPKPDPRYAQDAGDVHWKYADVLAVSLEQVQVNFARYGLLDQQVRFLKGWFRDTLPSAPVERLALLRLDGDMYSSTFDALEHLYPKLSPGGFVIVDDYGAVPACRNAVEDYRARHGITDAIRDIDGTGVFWQMAADGRTPDA